MGKARDKQQGGTRETRPYQADRPRGGHHALFNTDGSRRSAAGQAGSPFHDAAGLRRRRRNHPGEHHGGRTQRHRQWFRRELVGTRRPQPALPDLAGGRERLLRRRRRHGDVHNLRRHEPVGLFDRQRRGDWIDRRWLRRQRARHVQRRQPTHGRVSGNLRSRVRSRHEFVPGVLPDLDELLRNRIHVGLRGLGVGLQGRQQRHLAESGQRRRRRQRRHHRLTPATTGLRGPRSNPRPSRHYFQNALGRFFISCISKQKEKPHIGVFL